MSKSGMQIIGIEGKITYLLKEINKPENMM
jgi:hypothetical protein